MDEQKRKELERLIAIEKVKIAKSQGKVNSWMAQIENGITNTTRNKPKAKQNDIKVTKNDIKVTKKDEIPDEKPLKKEVKKDFFESVFGN